MCGLSSSVRTTERISLLPYSTRVNSPALKIMHTFINYTHKQMWENHSDTERERKREREREREREKEKWERDREREKEEEEEEEGERKREKKGEGEGGRETQRDKGRNGGRESPTDSMSCVSVQLFTAKPLGRFPCLLAKTCTDLPLHSRSKTSRFHLTAIPPVCKENNKQQQKNEKKKSNGI